MGSEMSCSVVILTADDVHGLAILARAIDDQNVQPTEVVVVDNSKTSAIHDFVAGRSETACIPWKFVPVAPVGGYSFGLARMKGAAVAGSEILVYISGDAVPASDSWLSGLLEPFRSDDVVAVQCRENPATKSFLWERSGSQVFHFTAEHRRWVRKYGFGFSFTCAAVRRQALLDSGIESYSVGDDKAFQRALSTRGARFTQGYPSAVVNHDHRYTSRAVVNRLKQSARADHGGGARYGFRDLVADELVALGLLGWFLPKLVLQSIRETGDPAVRRAEWSYLLVRPPVVWKEFRRISAGDSAGALDNETGRRHATQ